MFSPEQIGGFNAPVDTTGRLLNCPAEAGNPQTEAAQENPIRQRCEPEVYNPLEVPWEQIKDDILRIERVHFGDNAFDEATFIDAFADLDGAHVLLRDTHNRRVVGFTYALPAEKSYDEEFHPERLNEIRALDARVAYIEDTAIDPEYTGHRLVGPLIAKLEEALVKKGYGYLDRDAAVVNNYAANIAKAYGDRIVARYPHDSRYGPQVFFRIRLQTPLHSGSISPERIFAEE
jgi:hypothetical protein